MSPSAETALRQAKLQLEEKGQAQPCCSPEALAAIRRSWPIEFGYPFPEADAVSKSEELQRQWIAIQVEMAKSTAEKMPKLSESTGTPFTAEEYLESVAESS